MGARDEEIRVDGSMVGFKVTDIGACRKCNALSRGHSDLAVAVEGGFNGCTGANVIYRTAVVDVDHPRIARIVTDTTADVPCGRANAWRQALEKYRQSQG